VSASSIVDRFMRTVVRLLPRHQREWGSAMRAELAAIESRRERWRFAAGCLRAVATRTVVMQRFVFPVLSAAMLGVTLWWSGRFGYTPLRLVSLLVVAALVGLVRLGRVRGPFGPVGDGLAARGVRVGGFVLAALWAAGLAAAIAREDPVVAANAGVPIIGLIVACYLAGFLVLTAKPAGPARVMTAGLIGGASAVGTWTFALLLVPPIPNTAGPAVLQVALGMLLAAVLTGRGGRRFHAAACAGMLGAILIASLVMVLSSYAPAQLIPHLADHALTPADSLAQSRAEIEEPYLTLLVLGTIPALLAGLGAIGWRNRRVAA
jgi:hypothetical protein